MEHLVWCPWAKKPFVLIVQTASMVFFGWMRSIWIVIVSKRCVKDLLAFTEKTKSYKFRMAWAWLNNNGMLFFWEDYSFKIFHVPSGHHVWWTTGIDACDIPNPCAVTAKVPHLSHTMHMNAILFQDFGTDGTVWMLLYKHGIW